jgi:hypothetical protein
VRTLQRLSYCGYYSRLIVAYRGLVVAIYAQPRKFLREKLAVRVENLAEQKLGSDAKNFAVRHWLLFVVILVVFFVEVVSFGFAALGHHAGQHEITRDFDRFVGGDAGLFQGLHPFDELVENRAGIDVHFGFGRGGHLLLLTGRLGKQMLSR